MLPEESETSIFCKFRIGKQQMFFAMELVVKNGKPYLVLNLSDETQDLELDPDQIQKSPKGAQAPYTYEQQIVIQAIP